MRAGRLCHRLRLQTRIGAKNSFSETEYSWSTFDTVWAAVEPLSAREQLVAGQNRNETTHRITLRWRSGVLPTMRGVGIDGELADRIFIFGAVLNRDERNRELTVMATEVEGG